MSLGLVCWGWGFGGRKVLSREFFSGLTMEGERDGEWKKRNRVVMGEDANI
jgi:hypothetical protein